MRDIRSKNLSILDFNHRLLKMSLSPKIPISDKYNFALITYSNICEFITSRLFKSFISEREELNTYISSMFNFISILTSKLDKLVIHGELSEIHHEHLNSIYSNNIATNLFEEIENEKYYFIFSNEEDKLFYYEMKYFILEFDNCTIYEEDALYYFFKNIIGINIKEFGVFQYYKNIVHNQNVLGKDEYSNLQKTYVSVADTDLLWNILLSTADINFINKVNTAMGIEYELEVMTLTNSCINAIKFQKFLPLLFSKESRYPDIKPLYYKNDYINIDKDILVYNPYNSYDMVLDFIEQVCLDKNTTTIFITIYRTNTDSRIINALINAAIAKKDVFINIETAAKGNEEDNIDLIENLSNAGCMLSFNFYERKIHCKFFCAISVNKIYSHISTGNYNQSTSKFYTDLNYLTADSNIGSSILSICKIIFAKITPLSITSSNLLENGVTFNNRDIIYENFDREIDKGVNGKIFIKCNNIFDGEIIKRIYAAGEAGCNIKILVRNDSPIKRIYPNLQIRSKLGKLLEHDRMYIFGDSAYMSSLDLMGRNLDRRLEILFRVPDIDISKNILNIFNWNWNNTSNLWEIKYTKSTWTKL